MPRGSRPSSASAPTATTVREEGDSNGGVGALDRVAVSVFAQASRGEGRPQKPLDDHRAAMAVVTSRVLREKRDRVQEALDETEGPRKEAAMKKAAQVLRRRLAAASEVAAAALDGRREPPPPLDLQPVRGTSGSGGSAGGAEAQSIADRLRTSEQQAKAREAAAAKRAALIEKRAHVLLLQRQAEAARSDPELMQELAQQAVDGERSRLGRSHAAGSFRPSTGSTVGHPSAVRSHSAATGGGVGLLTGSRRRVPSDVQGDGSMSPYRADLARVMTPPSRSPSRPPRHHGNRSRSPTEPTSDFDGWNGDEGTPNFHDANVEPEDAAELRDDEERYEEIVRLWPLPFEKPVVAAINRKRQKNNASASPTLARPPPVPGSPRAAMLGVQQSPVKKPVYFRPSPTTDRLQRGLLTADERTRLYRIRAEHLRARLAAAGEAPPPPMDAEARRTTGRRDSCMPMPAPLRISHRLYPGNMVFEPGKKAVRRESKAHCLRPASAAGAGSDSEGDGGKKKRVFDDAVMERLMRPTRRDGPAPLSFDVTQHTNSIRKKGPGMAAPSSRRSSRSASPNRFGKDTVERIYTRDRELRKTRLAKLAVELEQLEHKEQDAVRKQLHMRPRHRPVSAPGGKPIKPSAEYDAQGLPRFTADRAEYLSTEMASRQAVTRSRLLEEAKKKIEDAQRYPRKSRRRLTQAQLDNHVKHMHEIAIHVREVSVEKIAKRQRRKEYRAPSRSEAELQEQFERLASRRGSTYSPASPERSQRQPNTAVDAAATD